MKIAAISDLHGNLPSLKKMPEADVLCIAGDIAPLEGQENDANSVSWFCLEFLPWIEKLPYEKVIFVAGNHDFFLHNIGPVAGRDADMTMEKLIYKTARHRYKKLVYLCDSSYTFKKGNEKVKFWGTPWCAKLESWAFYLPDTIGSNPYWQPRGRISPYNNLKDTFDKIPSGYDVIITHMPPKTGTSGTVLQKTSWNYGREFGSPILADRLSEIDYKYLLCGHVHTGCHEPLDVFSGKVVNVSYLNEDYKPTYEPFTFEL